MKHQNYSWAFTKQWKGAFIGWRVFPIFEDIILYLLFNLYFPVAASFFGSIDPLVWTCCVLICLFITEGSESQPQGLTLATGPASQILVLFQFNLTLFHSGLMSTLFLFPRTDHHRLEEGDVERNWWPQVSNPKRNRHRETQRLPFIAIWMLNPSLLDYVLIKILCNIHRAVID